ncbi:MAG: DUF1801 domain-containing protein [Saprospiraceae bacterium]|nr:DUF1801 domain-containing protein [Saprospiraceae bacterium]
MSKNQNKTVENDGSVEAFLDSVTDTQKKKDSYELLATFQEITGQPPKMWGNSLIGFGSYHYKYDTGREGDMLRTGFSPRKNALTLYIMDGFTKRPELMEKLGKYKTGKSCLYVKKLDDIDRSVLKEVIQSSLDYMNEKYPE